MLYNLLSSWVMNTITQKSNVIYTMRNDSSSDSEDFV